MTKCVLIRLDWPDARLAPHAKGSRWPKIHATAAARETAAWEAKLRGVKLVNAPHDLHLEYFPPDKRRRDVSNVNSMLKAAIDGIADALGVDDSTFEIHYPVRFSEVQKGGAILVEVRSRDA